MACNMCSRQNNSCWWTLVIIAAVLVWMNCGCGAGGCSGGCSGNGNGSNGSGCGCPSSCDY